jgi:UDPglucose 6-dehydrogenase
VLGAGYVGLVTAACFAKLGHTVTCIDIDRERVVQLKQGEMPIAEPGLQQLLRAGVAAGALEFGVDLPAARNADLVIIAVGTLDQSGEWSGEAVRRAVIDLASASELPRRVVIRSTLMPGTAAGILADARALDPRIEIAHNPEFTREGSAVTDFMAPDRIVIGLDAGADTSEMRRKAEAMYAPLSAPMLFTDLSTAEMIKIGSNVFLATKIAFANELARLSEAAGADIHAVVDGLGSDPRIGRSFLSPGPGFGGACLPSQSRALPVVANQLGLRTPIIDSIAASNSEAMRWIVHLLRRNLGGSVEGKVVGLLGATFKAGTDDLRESPALVIARDLAGAGASVRLYDPTDARRALPVLAEAGVEADACPDPLDAATGVDALVILTEWQEFRELDWPKLARVMRGRIVVDGRGMVDASRAAAAGLHVVGVSRRETH